MRGLEAGLIAVAAGCLWLPNALASTPVQGVRPKDASGGTVFSVDALGSMRAVLQASGIDAKLLDSVPASSQPQGEQRSLVTRILYRLERLDGLYASATLANPPQRLAENPAAFRGDLVELTGRVKQVERWEDRNATGSPIAGLVRCEMRLDAGEIPAVVWTQRAPAAWPSGAQLNERATVRGVFAGVAPTERGPDAIVLIASRVQWHPDQLGRITTSVGHHLLGDAGVDVGRLDELRHEGRLTASDHEVFYQILEAVREVSHSLLVQRARESIDIFAQPWQMQAKTMVDMRRELQRQLAAPDLSREQRVTLSRDLRRTRQRELLARAVITASAEGRYSVAPLFLDAPSQTGQLFVFEGVARRAIRILVESDSSRGIDDTQRFESDHYFELEVFTADSQNLPIVCCVPALPPGFPTGDRIREPVQVTGFFLKKWRFDSRTPQRDVADPLRFESTAAPVLIATLPAWPRTDPEGPSQTLNWIAVGVFLVVLTAIGGALWCWSRGDRRIRQLYRRGPVAGQLPPSID